MLGLPRWLRVPVQELESLSRCRECGTLVRDSQENLRKHLGHRLEPIAGLHVTEWARLKLGLM